MNQRTVNKVITELERLRAEGKSVNDPSALSLILNVKASFGIHSDEFATVAKAADRIFGADR